MKPVIMWRGDGYYAHRPSSNQWERVRPDRITSLRSRGIEVRWFPGPPFGWIVRTRRFADNPDKILTPGDEVAIIYAGREQYGSIQEPGKPPNTWVVLVVGNIRPETIHERFIHKLVPEELTCDQATPIRNPSGD